MPSVSFEPLSGVLSGVGWLLESLSATASPPASSVLAGGELFGGVAVPTPLTLPMPSYPSADLSVRVARGFASPQLVAQRLGALDMSLKVVGDGQALREILVDGDDALRYLT